ncbi:MAG TPA: osmotically inducible protein OsmC [Candidatus Aminicenantes bacterium]|nr:OsmC family protein [Candidatus Aminicenantes bacterium]HDT12820.1 osmotically inducible protein OsmC [Candidatus Aminicenantes bacterium]
MSPKELKVVFGDKYKIDVDYKGFTIKTDQPVRDGGDGTAPAPFDYFLASLASCAGYYALAFCRERKIPTEGLAMTMTAEKGESSRLMERITIAVALPEGFPDKYRRAVVKAIDHCTVKANILQAPRFEVVVRP